MLHREFAYADDVDYFGLDYTDNDANSSEGACIKLVN